MLRTGLGDNVIEPYTFVFIGDRTSQDGQVRSNVGRAVNFSGKSRRIKNHFQADWFRRLIPFWALLPGKNFRFPGNSCQFGCEMHRDVAKALLILGRGLSTFRNQSLPAPFEKWEVLTE